MAKDYVITGIDTDRMLHGRELARRLRGKRRGGIPWMVILGGGGQELVTSDGPEGNVGFPVKPQEVSWFLEMLRRTAHKLQAADLARLKASLTGPRKKAPRHP